MADILIGIPEVGENISITFFPEDRFIFDFDTSNVELDRIGDDLIFSFDNGAKIYLENFYITFHADNMPEFIIDGDIISGEAFFATLDTILMPAAGMTTVINGSGSSQDFVMANLHGGIDRTGRLDQAFYGAADAHEVMNNLATPENFSNANLVFNGLANLSTDNPDISTQTKTTFDQETSENVNQKQPQEPNPSLPTNPDQLQTDSEQLPTQPEQPPTQPTPPPIEPVPPPTEPEQPPTEPTPPPTEPVPPPTQPEQPPTEPAPPPTEPTPPPTAPEQPPTETTPPPTQPEPEQPPTETTPPPTEPEQPEQSNNIVDVSSKEDLFLDDSNLSNGTNPNASNAVQGELTFTSIDSMHGGKIILNNIEFTITKNTDGSYSLTPNTVVNSQSGYGNITLNGLSENNGEFTLTYTYSQTDSYEHNNIHNHNELHHDADSFTISIQDGEEANGAEQGVDVTINVGIYDDGPVVTGMSTGNESTAIIIDGDATATLDVDFGADGAHQIVTSSVLSTTGYLSATWNAETGTWQGFLVQHSAGSNVVKIGDAILVQGDDGKWNVSYDAESGRDLTLIFVDGDGDSSSHTIITPKVEETPPPVVTPNPEEPTLPPHPSVDEDYVPPPPLDLDIKSTGDVNDTILNMEGHNKVQVSSPQIGETPTMEIIEGVDSGMTVDVDDGNDTVYLSKGDDTIYLGESHCVTLDKDPAAESAAQDSLVLFMTGDDSSILQNGLNEASGLSASVSQMSRPYVDIAYSGDGNDTIYGEGGTDLIFAGAHNDTVYGGAGNDGIRGGSGNDLLFGGSGNDIIDGGTGNDFIIGGSGTDTLRGGSGNDIIIMDFEDVFVDGGMGMDVLLAGSDDLDIVKEKLNDGSIDHMEVVIAGEVAGQTTDEVLQNSGAVDDAGQWIVEDASSGWVEKTGENTPDGYREFIKTSGNEGDTDSEMTILIEQTILTTQ